MSIRWTDQQRQIAEVMLRNRTEEKSGYDFNTVQNELSHISGGRISEVAAALRDNGWIMPAKEEKAPPERGGGNLATVVQPVKGAIVFALGEHKISLNPQHLYDAFLYYEDIMIRHNIDEEFSLALKDAMKYVWETFNHRKAESEGAEITMEEE